MPLANLTNTKSVVVPSRYALPTGSDAKKPVAVPSVRSQPEERKKPATGMPLVRSQLEALKAQNEAYSSAEKAATAKLASLQSSYDEAMLLHAAEIDRLKAAHAAQLGATAELHKSNFGVASTSAAEATERATAAEAERDEARAALEAERSAMRKLERQVAKQASSLQALRDVQLPAASRAAETQRSRAERAEAHATTLRAALASREASLRDALGHLETLRRSLCEAEGEPDGGLVGSAQTALSCFSLLYSERGLHKDERFAALQDVLVRNCMLAGRLAEWMPWFAATKEAELRRTLEDAEVEARGRAEDEGAGGGLSPELPAGCTPRGAGTVESEGRDAGLDDEAAQARAALLF